ncbi:hypothetical protein JCM10908_005744 [Rhodotorula pacifica]|uniref:uncharacterized protein n=1 Tax=Rhodotorula pacifica TaxID=1495444 RepID=UPI00317C882A
MAPGIATDSAPSSGAGAPPQSAVRDAKTASTGGEPIDSSMQHHRKLVAQRNVELLSLPTRDLPTYYDSTSSVGSDSDLSDFGGIDERNDDHLVRPSPAHPVPTTNRGHKLSRLAPHTRRGKLGHYPHADAGFAQDAPPGSVGGDLSAGAALPAQKRRKLNDVAPFASEAGFPIAPNLHLVPRPVHALSPREADRPAPAYLPPVPQSPLDLLLMPSVQHTLGKKNQTFHLLGASATALIEQEAELINALSKVCRGLRGEGFEWRWEGDAGRRQAKKDAAAAAKMEEQEGRKGAVVHPGGANGHAEAEQPVAGGSGSASTPTPAPAAVQVPAAQPEVSAPNEGTPSESAPANPAVADLQQGDGDVKLEQATPVLQSAVPPRSTSTSAEEQVAVPGVSGVAASDSAPQDAEMRPADAEDASAQADRTPALTENAEANAEPSSTAGTTEKPTGTTTATATPSLASAVTAAVIGQGTESGAGGSAPPLSASETGTAAAAATDADDAAAARSSAAPATTTPAAGQDGNETAKAAGDEVPAIAVTGPGASSISAGEEAAVKPADETPLPTEAAAGAAAPNAMEVDESATGEATPAPSTAGGGDDSASASLTATATATATAAAASRRRSGRVPAAGRVRHTRSRQSSPEDEGLYTSAGEDDALLYGEEEVEPSAAATAGRRRGAAPTSTAAAAGAGARAQLVPEEEMPEYAERMIDPEGYVRSLFVTEEKVELERLVPAPTGGVVGTGQFDSLTPNEQEVLLHDCMTDLHRFLADALEYRNRLSEIRDGILGVERRRKGMWKVVRTVANDFLAEEEGAVYGQQHLQQQQQDGGGGYE